MPCVSDHMDHTARERESGIVLELLKEIDGKAFDHENPSYYGNESTLDADTARLCAWCDSHDVASLSLELQLWWRRHQAADAKRAVAEQKERTRQETVKHAKEKLTLAERKALGIK